MSHDLSPAANTAPESTPRTDARLPTPQHRAIHLLSETEGYGHLNDSPHWYHPRNVPGSYWIDQWTAKRLLERGLAEVRAERLYRTAPGTKYTGRNPE